MLFVAPVRPEKRDVLPAITHEDGSGRLQTVFKDVSPAYHRMIERFGGVGSALKALPMSRVHTAAARP